MAGDPTDAQGPPAPLSIQEGGHEPPAPHDGLRSLHLSELRGTQSSF